MNRGYMSVWVVLLAGITTALAFAQQQAKKPPVMSHELEGRSNCVMCHAPGAMEPVPDMPASHEGWPNEACLWCHAEDAEMQTAEPTAIPHELEGRSNCVMCHAPGAMEPVPDMPASHEGRENEHCGICHEPAEGG